MPSALLSIVVFPVVLLSLTSAVDIVSPGVDEKLFLYLNAEDKVQLSRASLKSSAAFVQHKVAHHVERLASSNGKVKADLVLQSIDALLLFALQKDKNSYHQIVRQKDKNSYHQIVRYNCSLDFQDHTSAVLQNCGIFTLRSLIIMLVLQLHGTCCLEMIFDIRYLTQCHGHRRSCAESPRSTRPLSCCVVVVR